MLTLNIQDFSIDQIARSGQCFRIDPLPEEKNTWRVIAFGRQLHVKHAGGNDFIFYCSEGEFMSIWQDYFDLKSDYAAIKREIIGLNDPYLRVAVEYGGGIRILRQDLWEVIVSFLISQRNSIMRIKNTICRLCSSYGNDFPTADMLAEYSEQDFIQLGMGYRAKYLLDISRAVVAGRFDLGYLRLLDATEARKYLKSFYGIGDKVADCIILYGLHRLEAFPIDTWIDKIIQNHYNGHFSFQRFADYAGVVQQYMFFYERNAKQH